MGNRVLKELICIIHGHGLRVGMLEGWGVQGRGEIEGENWENCNSIINKKWKKRRVRQICMYCQGKVSMRSYMEKVKSITIGSHMSLESVSSSFQRFHKNFCFSPPLNWFSLLIGSLIPGSLFPVNLSHQLELIF